PFDLLGRRVTLIVTTAGLVLHHLTTGRGARVAIGGRHAHVARRLAAERRIRDRHAVAALRLDRRVAVALRDRDLALDDRIGETRRAVHRGEAALLHELLAFDQVLHALFGDPLLTVVLAVVAEVALVGIRRRETLEARAAGRRHVVAAAAQFHRV